MANDTNEVAQTDQEILKAAPWREADKEARVDFIAWATVMLTERQIFGQQEYGDIFQGDPALHGLEECMDQFFYLYYAKKNIEFLEGQRNEFRHVLESVVEFGLTEQIWGDIYKVLNVPEEQQM